jgi:hypothetical protein
MLCQRRMSGGARGPRNLSADDAGDNHQNKKLLHLTLRPSLMALVPQESRRRKQRCPIDTESDRRGAERPNS